MVSLGTILPAIPLLPLCCGRGILLQQRPWRNGKRSGLKIRSSQGVEGSSPSGRTNDIGLKILRLERAVPVRVRQRAPSCFAGFAYKLDAKQDVFEVSAEEGRCLARCGLKEER